MEAFRYTILIVGAVFLLLFVFGLLYTAFHSEPAPDYIEEALEEVTKKRGKKK